MDKLNMHTKDFASVYAEKLAQLFPECITEVLDNQSHRGGVKRAIDLDKLKQLLSTDVVDGTKERYQFTWPDKKKAIRMANAPTNMTLRPCREDSVNFDTTENLYIEGDNLEVLKLLREDYLGKVKMIYIDPPYNTGSDFVYEDDFARTSSSYLGGSGQLDEMGNRLVQNTESNGRFHTDWLNMIYPRLKVAKDLLSKNGVIFISIDDHETINLHKVCNEIFGEVNYIGTFIWQSKKGGGSDNNKVVRDQEYVLCYGKDTSCSDFFNRILLEAEPLVQCDQKGPYRRGRELNKWGANSRREDRPTMFFPIPGPNGEDVYPIRNDGSEGCWRWGKENMLQAAMAGDVEFVPRGDGTYIVYEKVRDTEPRLKPYRTLLDNVGATADGSKQIKGIFDDKKVFDFPKPLNLIESLLLMGATKDCLILDFFAGSSTTAHAILEANAKDGGTRSYILVQLPELTDPASEAYKAGYKNICDIGKERIRRAGKRILEEQEKSKSNAGLFAQTESKPKVDVGFRVLKLDSSNMQDVYYRPEESSETTLFEDNIKPDRTPEDLLFQVMLECNLPLSAKIETKKIAGKDVFSVNNGYLIACFDTDVDEDVIKAVAKIKPYYFIMRDRSLSSDNVADNFDQIFQAYSKETIRRVL